MGNKKTKQKFYEEVDLKLDDRFIEFIFNDKDDPEQVDNFVKKFKYKYLQAFETDR